MLNTTLFRSSRSALLRETELRLTPVEAPRRILVVGAGPAGLKAAEVAARRGHEVHLYDASTRPGGRLREAGDTAAAALVSSIEYVVAELGGLGVKVVQGTVGADELREIDPDEVIVATGTQANVAAAFPGAAEAGAVDSSVALHAELGHRVLVYDTLGANEGALVGEALARRGHRVTFVTPFETAMPQGGELHRVQLGTTLHGVVDRVLVRALVGLVEEGTVTVASPEGAVIDEIEVDAIVVAVAPVPALGLVPVLQELGIGYRIVGDAVSPRLAMQAFKEGHEAGLAV